MKTGNDGNDSNETMSAGLLLLLLLVLGCGFLLLAFSIVMHYVTRWRDEARAPFANADRNRSDAEPAGADTGGVEPTKRAAG